jgi:release factor glutamine methyltransferase
MTAPALAPEMPPPLAVEGDTAGVALSRAAALLREAGVEGSRRDARLLLAEALSASPGALFGTPEQRLSGPEAARFAGFVARRRAREPVSRILGRREFWSLSFAIGPATLDPRPDSEALVEAILARARDLAGPLSILDLGTGSGCLLLALLSELPEARGLGVDRDPAALAMAWRNALSLGLEDRAAFAVGDWGAAVAGQWRVIVCNPPYVRHADVCRLAPEVARYDPRAALDGGGDGLAAYRRVIPDIADLLAPDGLAAVELGSDLADAVETLIREAGLVPSARARDLGGIERCLLFGTPPARKKGLCAGKKVVGKAGHPD